MATIRETALNYINDLPEDTLQSLIPLLRTLSKDMIYLEKVEFDDLSESEKRSILQGRKEDESNELIDFDDYVIEQRNV
jgi:hypothetical protein